MRFRPVFVAITCVSLAGCAGESAEEYEAQQLTRVEDGKAEGCENGGVRLSTGVDENKNGKLDDDEIKDERVVCAGDTVKKEGSELTRVDALDIGSSECPAGGVAILRGIDDNLDEALGDEEVDTREVVCNTPRYKVLTRTTPIAVLSPECQWGGKRIDTGSDDGDGAGEPDDGVLADEEVETSYIDCNNAPSQRGEAIDPPDGPAGTAVIDLRGGDAGSSPAGGGGRLQSLSDGDATCAPAITKFFPTGVVDASFQIPAIAVDLGALPLSIDTNTTLPLYPGPTAATNGAYYYNSSDGTIGRFSTALSRLESVTGLRVAAGATLTFPTAQVNLYFQRDVEVLGTILLGPGRLPTFSLYARIVHASPSSLIDVSSVTTSSLTLEGSQVFALGQLLARGSDTNGSAGGDIRLLSRGRLFVSGNIDATGGDSTAGQGGAGGTVSAQAGAGGVYSSARINVSGGAGSTAGGNGGTIELGGSIPRDFTERLDLRNQGVLEAHGGAQTLSPCTDTASCTGGAGGNINVRSIAADLRNSGELKANGGSSHRAAGSGGYLTLEASLQGGQSISALTTQRISVSGTIEAKGGVGLTQGAGGPGGTVAFFNCGSSDTVFEWLGYQAIALQGGAAPTSYGGQGGSFRIYADRVASRLPKRLYLHVPINGAGGEGATGGAGGTLDVQLSSFAAVDEELPSELPAVISNQTHVFTGARGTSLGGGAGGFFDIRARGKVVMRGSVNANAGSSVTFNQSAYAGTIAISSLFAAVENHAALSANGGDVTTGDGYTGGCVGLDGTPLSNDATLAARGGNAGARGGEGGRVTLLSRGSAGTNTGTLDVSGGTGAVMGSAGLSGFDLAWCQ